MGHADKGGAEVCVATRAPGSLNVGGKVAG